MRTRTLLMAVAVAAASALLPDPVSALLSEPEHIFYGQAGTYGVPLSAGTVTAVLDGATTPIATFTASPATAGRYVLRIPIDSVDPQAPGTARAGDVVRFYVDGVLAGNGVVGDRGTAQPLDLDRMFDDTVSVADASVTEPDNGTIEAEFTLTLSEPSAVEVRIGLVTVNGTATAPGDYAPLTTASAVFPAGTVSQVVKVVVNGDLLSEADETFFVDLGGPVNTNLGRFRATGTIVNNDPPPGVSIADASVTEGNPGVGANPSATFTVSLSSPSGQVTTVDFATADGTAAAGVDYTAATGTVVFPAGTVSQLVSVEILRDSRYEGNETFAVNLSAPVGVDLGDAAATGTILNDDRRETDFDGDGKTDLLWRHEGDGRISVWRMDGLNRIEAVATTPGALTNLTWKIVATPDLDNDGRPEIVWRNNTTGDLVAWVMNGLVRQTSYALTPARLANLAWTIRTGADFNADGFEDLLWQNQTDGSITAWFMNGGIRQGSAALVPARPADIGWKVAAAGDFNGDGKPDLLFQHDDGRLEAWLLDGVTRTAAVALSPARLADLDWRVVGAGHFNDDLKTDVLWRNRRTGALVVWMMDGVNRVAGFSLNPSAVTDLQWQVVAPR